MEELDFWFLTIAFFFPRIQLHMLCRLKPHLSQAMEEMGFIG